MRFFLLAWAATGAEKSVAKFAASHQRLFMTRGSDAVNYVRILR
jgi:hypothetical protein